MKKYSIFIVLYTISFVAFIMMMGIFINNIILENGELIDAEPGTRLSFDTFLSPFIVAGFITMITSITYRIFGIVMVSKNKVAGDGEKALWIIGFVMMGMVTGIVFLVMAKGRKFVD